MLASLALAGALAVTAGATCAYAEEPTEGAALATSSANATADGNGQAAPQDAFQVQVSAEGQRATVDGTNVAADEFTQANKGSNRDLSDAYRGYNYIQPHEDMVVLIDAGSTVVVHIPQEQLDALGLSLSQDEDCALLKALLLALDAQASGGNIAASADATWHFTTDDTCTLGNVTYAFNQGYAGRFYSCVMGADGSDVTQTDNPHHITLQHADFAVLATADQTPITAAATGLSWLQKFFSELDFSPLWVTLKTTGTSIVIIFILGILLAWLSLHLPSRLQAVADALFTIPMVLPPTVCGFILLLCLGNNSPVGQWFNEIGFPLIFSWPATVIAAVVVAFPLMYRSARGAFENLDADMLDAARTLGWSEPKIFLRLMMPLAWSSIAAGTMLAFARALGEFGATLFLAGNYVGITRTIPIAIYFEWMGGNTDAAIFWTIVVIVLSFLVIIALNLWSKRTTRYRRKEEVNELER